MAATEKKSLCDKPLLKSRVENHIRTQSEGTEGILQVRSSEPWGVEARTSPSPNPSQKLALTSEPESSEQP